MRPADAKIAVPRCLAGRRNRRREKIRIVARAIRGWGAPGRGIRSAMMIGRIRIDRTSIAGCDQVSVGDVHGKRHVRSTGRQRLVEPRGVQSGQILRLPGSEALPDNVGFNVLKRAHDTCARQQAADQRDEASQQRCVEPNQRGALHAPASESTPGLESVPHSPCRFARAVPSLFLVVGTASAEMCGALDTDAAVTGVPRASRSSSRFVAENSEPPKSFALRWGNVESAQGSETSTRRQPGGMEGDEQPWTAGHKRLIQDACGACRCVRQPATRRARL